MTAAELVAKLAGMPTRAETYEIGQPLTDSEQAARFEAVIMLARDSVTNDGLQLPA